MSRYISGRYKKTPQSGLTTDRYRYLSPGDAEPNLGNPPPGGSPKLTCWRTISNNIWYSLMIIKERYWIPCSGWNNTWIN